MRKKNINSGKKQATEEPIEIQAAAEDNSKRRGEAAEAAFLAKACGLRFAVCKPWGDSERYDLVVDYGKGFWRVRVKAMSVYSRSKHQIKTESSTGRTYTREEIDFVVLYIVPENVW